MASMRRGMRSERWIPKAVYSSSLYPIPIPSTKRPPDIASRVAEVSATSTGIEQGNKEHRGRDLHALGVCGESREEGDDGAHLVRVREVVLTGAYHVEPGLTGEAGLLGGFGDALRDGLAGRVLGVDE